MQRHIIILCVDVFLFCSAMIDTTVSAEVTCNAGYTGTHDGSCVACSTGTYKSSINTEPCVSCPEKTNTIASASTSINQCLCDVEFTGANGGPCDACPIGKHKENVGSEACVTCDAHTSLANKYVTRFRVMSNDNAETLANSLCNLIPNKINLPCCNSRLNIQEDLAVTA